MRAVPTMPPKASTVDASGKIESFNAAAVRMFGWSPEEVLRSERRPPLPSGASGRHDRMAGRWPERAVHQYPGRTRDGRPTPESLAVPLGIALSRLDDRRPSRLHRYPPRPHRAATRRGGPRRSGVGHRAHRRLRGSLEPSRPHPVRERRGRRLVCIAPVADLHDLTLDDFIYPDDRAFFHETIVPTVLRDGRWQGEIRGRELATSEPVAAGVNLFLIRHPQTGRPTGFAAVCRDLREQKRIEDETQRAREATLAKEVAESASLAKSEFLATMSHEIRTPLNGVVGMSTLLAETPLDAEQRDYLQTIRLSSDQLLAVINDVLDFSKIESGKLELEAEPLAVRGVVEEVVDLFAERAHSKGASSSPPSSSRRRRRRCAATRPPPADPREPHQQRALEFTERGEVVVRAAAVGDTPTHTLPAPRGHRHRHRHRP
jgi:signal transduction histidine kinase